MKILKYIFFFALIAATFVACEKDAEQQKQITLTASTETASRTMLNGYNTNWSSGDVIEVYGTGTGIGEDFTATPLAEDATMAMFTGTEPTGDLISAIYPESNAVSISGIFLPPSYSTTSFQVQDGYMASYAVLDGVDINDVHFKNLLGIIKFGIMMDTGTATVNKIEFTSGDEIAGIGMISVDGSGNPTMSFMGGDNTITYTGSLDIDSNTAKDVYLMVPPTDANGFTVKVYTTAGDSMTKTAPSYTNGANNNKVERNIIKTMDNPIIVQMGLKDSDGGSDWNTGTGGGWQ